MSAYNAPIKDMEFILNDLGIIDQLQAMPNCADATSDLVSAILNEAGRLASEVIAPLNHSGDQEGCKFENGKVITPTGFKQAYQAFVDGGWNSIPFDPKFGGQGLPWAVSSAMSEIWQAANLSWGLCPLLNQGAIEAVSSHGNDKLKNIYLEKMISGIWSGTMNLTEPQAGSDISLIKSKAVKDGDSYLITGQKIFITYGEHDMAENIIHLVLARLPDAPAGVKGISLFLVPKILVNDDGTIGDNNDVKCISIEHKCGINASPTCVMSFGDNDGAIGYLLGEENNGLACMFTMMNNARLAVGLQGLAITNRSYQQASQFAKERKQGNDTSGSKETVAIIKHADVKRMLMTMRAYGEAQRAFVLDVMKDLDISINHTDDNKCQIAKRRVDLLTPVIKGWFCETAVETASIGVQVHGGMGFIEETGAAQYYRDARILPIYEGTTGIQAADLVGRKILRDKGKAAFEILAELDEIIDLAAGSKNNDIISMAKYLTIATENLRQAIDWILTTGSENIDQILATSSYFLKLFGIVMGGKMMLKSAFIANEKINQKTGDIKLYRMKIITARFYSENILSQSTGLISPITAGHNAIMMLDYQDL